MDALWNMHHKEEIKRKKKKCNSKQTAEAVFFYAQKCAERKEKDEFLEASAEFFHC
jgi:hypothetical protein